MTSPAVCTICKWPPCLACCSSMQQAACFPLRCAWHADYNTIALHAAQQPLRSIMLRFEAFEASHRADLSLNGVACCLDCRLAAASGVPQMCSPPAPCAPVAAPCGRAAPGWAPGQRRSPRLGRSAPIPQVSRGPPPRCRPKLLSVRLKTRAPLIATARCLGWCWASVNAQQFAKHETAPADTDSIPDSRKAGRRWTADSAAAAARCASEPASPVSAKQRPRHTTGGLPPILSPGGPEQNTTPTILKGETAGRRATTTVTPSDAQRPWRPPGNRSKPFESVYYAVSSACSLHQHDVHLGIWHGHAWVAADNGFWQPVAFEALNLDYLISLDAVLQARTLRGSILAMTCPSGLSGSRGPGGCRRTARAGAAAAVAALMWQTPRRATLCG